MDPVALASVITSGVLGVSTGGIAIWTAKRNAALAREQRVEQRAADAYLQILRLAEQEAQWLDTSVYNLELDRAEVIYGIVREIVVSEPPRSDRATAAALIAAYASVPVSARHAAWRSAADDYIRLIEVVRGSFAVTNDPNDVVSEDQMKEFKNVLQPAERAARHALADAVATELGHR